MGTDAWLRTRRWCSWLGRPDDASTRCSSRGGGSTRGEVPETEHGTGQVQQPLEQVGPSFVADTEAATAEQPRERALHHPSMAAQPLAGVDASPGDSWGNAARAQRTPQVRGVVGLAGVEFGRSFARSPRSPTRTDDGRDGIHQREQLRRIVGVGRREADGQRDAVAIHHKVVLGAGFAAVNGVRSCLLAPLFARTLKLSRLARLQSITASSPNQLRSVSCNHAHTPAACQSRSRRQQVAPLP